MVCASDMRLGVTHFVVIKLVYVRVSVSDMHPGLVTTAEDLRLIWNGFEYLEW